MMIDRDRRAPRAWLPRKLRVGLPGVVAACALLSVPLLAAETVPIVRPVSTLIDQCTVITGEKEEDWFGALAAVGDVNGDGYEDIAFIGVYRPDEEAVAYILYGRANLPPSVDLAQWEDWGIRLHAPYGQRYPCPRARLGDLDGDGYDDMIFRACIPLVAGCECPAYVLFGGANLPREIDTTTLEGCHGIWVHVDATIGHDEAQRFRSFAAGDLNGDGRRDLVVAEPFAAPEGHAERAGIVYVIFGTDPFPAELSLGEVGRTMPGCRITSSYLPLPGTRGPELGHLVRSGVDFNGDGFDDLAIVARMWDRSDGPGDERNGAIFVLFGRADWPENWDIDSENGDYCCILQPGDDSMLGLNLLETIPDVTGDDVADIVADTTGIIYLFSGRTLVPGRFLAEEFAWTIFEGGYPSVAAGLPNWDGDTTGDLVITDYYDDSPYLGGAVLAGAVYILSGGEDLPQRISLTDTAAFLGKIVGSAQRGRLGEYVLGADLNGDGATELVIAEPGFALMPIQRGFQPKLYIIPNGVDLRGALRCASYRPRGCPLTGATQVTVTGRGFDETTQAFFGETEATILDRANSQTLLVEAPAQDAAGHVPLSVHRGDETCTFADDFDYYESLFPRELNVLELGDRGCTIFEPRWENANYAFQTRDYHFQNGEDFNGDGLGDVLMIRYAPYLSGHADTVPFHEAILLYGSPELPAELLADDLSPWAATFVGDTQQDEQFAYAAISVGDMNGDGFGELAILALAVQRVFVVFGGHLATGRHSVYDLIEQGRGFVIEGCPPGSGAGTAPRLGKIGDVNGDGLADFAISTRLGLGPEGAERGSVAFVLGSAEAQESVSFADLPKFYGKRTMDYCTITLVEGVGDVDGDGFSDVRMRIAFVPPDPYQHEITLFHGRPSLDLETTYEDEIAGGGLARLLHEQGHWVSRVAGIGDQDGDGKDDLAFYGIPHVNDLFQPEHAKLHILYGRTRNELNDFRDIAADEDFDVTFTTTPEYNGYFRALNGGRDLNGDGMPEILIRDEHGNDDGAPPPSRAIAIFGGNLEGKAGPIGELSGMFDLVNSHTGTGEFGARFPTRIDFAGDVNGDGYGDLVVSDISRFYIYYNPMGGLVYKDFIRGDANQDNAVNIADAIFILQNLFASGPPIPCMDGADANDDEGVNIGDGIYILQNLFADGPPVPPPAACGPDPEGVLLDCRESICP